MKAAIYARVSTTDQNCEMQLRELREYVARRGWGRAAEYVDTGFSGAKASRPALDRLMTAAARREFDCVLVWKIDRFGRSVLHLSQQLAALTSHEVRFIAISQAIDTDASNPASRLLMHILAGVAEFEREIIRERTLAGVRAARAAGKALGRPRRVFRRDEVAQLRAEGPELARDRTGAGRSHDHDQVCGNRPSKGGGPDRGNKASQGHRVGVRKTFLFRNS